MLNHPDPRFCVCGHHQDGHMSFCCFGANCPCPAFVDARPILAAQQRGLMFARRPS